jgi:hypothetical protein
MMMKNSTISAKCAKNVLSLFQPTLLKKETNNKVIRFVFGEFMATEVLGVNGFVRKN